MEQRRLIRIGISCITAAVIALGGYYLGYAKTQETAPGDDIKSPAFLDKFATDFCLYAVKHNATKIGIKPEELKKLLDSTKPLLDQYLTERRKLWQTELRDAKEAEDGLILNASGRFDVHNFYDLQIETNKRSAFDSASIRLEIATSKLLGEKRQHQLNLIRHKTRLDDSATSLDLILDPKNADYLGLSQAQKNQITLLEAFFVYTMVKPSTPVKTQIRLEDVLPEREKNHEAVMKAPDMMKSYFYYQALDRLSPVQRVRLKALVCDKIYVQL